MKLASLLATVLFTVTAPAVHAHAEHGQPQYGGIYGEAGTFQLELVIKDKQVILYATNHDAELSTKGATGKLTILAAEGKIEAELKPAGENQLVAELRNKPAKGSKIVATVTLPGKKPANVRYAIE
jgi:hypothetical protein